MFKRFPYLFSGLLFAGLFMAVIIPPGDGNNVEKEALIMQSIVRNLERYHFDPTVVNDDFSAEAYEAYLDELDRSRLFFTEADLNQLGVYEDKIDDQILAGNFNFFEKSQELLNAKRELTQSWYKEILSKPFDLNKKGTITMLGEDDNWVANDKKLKKYWHDYLKRDLVRRIDNKKEQLKKAAEKAKEAGESSEAMPSLDELEAEAREEILETFDKYFERETKVKRSQEMAQYINTLTSLYDPHTNYLRPRDKERFDIQFRGRLEGIGATLTPGDDYTRVSSIVVGGPAWKGKELKEDDLIMAVRQDGEEALDIKGMELDDVVSKIRGPKGTKVFLTVKKTTGEIEEIMIERDVVVIDEGFAKSLILDGAEAGEKIGYIYLPGFYADWEDPTGHFASKDVAIELEKLKKAKVDGVILDLRNNGGGSLTEAIKLTGLFIPEGPVVQVQDRINNKDVLRDKDDRVQYEGPLAIMVNQYSASASEILAAALQDYKRAVIVGSKSTFGKGTVQTFFDLDRTLRGFDEIKPLGNLKLTIQKYFRITGGSVQLRGVTSDIILPDTYSQLELGEKRQSNPMEWTKIEGVPFEQNIFRVDNLEELQKASAARVAQNPTFGLVKENAKRFKRLRDRDTYQLSLSDYEAEEAILDAEAEKFKKMFDDEVNTGVENLAVDKAAISIDESKEARNEDFLKGVKKDIYINETLHVLHDLMRKQ